YDGCGGSRAIAGRRLGGSPLAAALSARHLPAVLVRRAPGATPAGQAGSVGLLALAAGRVRDCLRQWDMGRLSEINPPERGATPRAAGRISRWWGPPRRLPYGRARPLSRSPPAARSDRRPGAR